MRRSPRKHKVREHGRGKPTGGRTDVGPYDRGRSRSTTSSSAGGRAQARTVLLKARDAGDRALDAIFEVESDVFADRWATKEPEEELI